jgi:hypothetical protein
VGVVLAGVTAVLAVVVGAVMQADRELQAKVMTVRTLELAQVLVAAVVRERLVVLMERDTAVTVLQMI